MAHIDALLAVARTAEERINQLQAELTQQAHVRAQALEAVHRMVVEGKKPGRLVEVFSRCPACLNMAQEGTKHRCPAGRHRDVFPGDHAGPTPARQELPETTP